MVKIDKSSWHYHFAKLWDEWGLSNLTLCQYIRKVLAGMLTFSILSAACIGLIGGNLLGLADLYFGLWGIHSPYAAMNVLAIIAFLAIFIRFWLIPYIREVIYKHRYAKAKLDQYIDAESMEKKPASFLRLWLHTVHSRVCTKVEYE